MDDLERLEAARLEVGQAMAKTMDLYGFNPSTGMLYSLLYFNEAPLSLDDLAMKLGVSKTTVCNGVHNMEERGLLYKTWQRGSRRDYYSADTNFFTNFITYFSTMWQREIDVNLKAIGKAEPVLQELANGDNQDISERARLDLEKLTAARQYYGWLEKMVNALENGKIFEYISREDSTPAI